MLLLIQFNLTSQTSTEEAINIPSLPIKSQAEILAEDIETNIKFYSDNYFKAFSAVPRDVFVPDKFKNFAYKNNVIPLGAGLILPEPYLIANIINNLQPAADTACLIIGKATGYSAAILSRICNVVNLVEHDKKYLKINRTILKEQEFNNIVFNKSYKDFPSTSFDCIFINAAVKEVPFDLVSKLKPGGRLITSLLGDSGVQTLILIRKKGTSISISNIGDAFLPEFEDFE